MKEGKGGIMTWILAAPLLALFLGAGVFAFSISESWTNANTQAAITGISAVCGTGIVVLGLIVGLIVGVPIAIRAYGEGGRVSRNWETPAPPPVNVPWQALPPAQSPPALPGPQANPWMVTGGGNIDDMPAPVQDGRFRMVGGGQ
jgi:hypothetical protein